MNLHLSEIVSEIIEPVADTFKSGFEVISTEDCLARIDARNSRKEGWTPLSWWEGRTNATGEFIACGKCVSLIVESGPTEAKMHGM